MIKTNKPTQILKHKRLYSIWVTILHILLDKTPQKVWDYANT